MASCIREMCLLCAKYNMKDGSCCDAGVTPEEQDKRKAMGLCTGAVYRWKRFGDAVPVQGNMMLNRQTGLWEIIQ